MNVLLALGGVLLIVLDDVGSDKLFATVLQQDPSPVTPNLEALAARGVVYREVWVAPVCSPSRACMQTGLQPWRHGIGNIVLPKNLLGPLDPAFQTLPEALPADWATAYFGKWHLGYAQDLGTGSPDDHGYDHFVGTEANFDERAQPPEGYSYWTRIEDGASSIETQHATEHLVDLAAAWIAGRSGAWFATVAFQAAHQPWERPPGSALPKAYPLPDDPIEPYYRAMIEHLDAEIGRLLASLPADTLVFVISDNGTPSGVGRDQLIAAPFDPTRGKGTLYEGGLRVPLVVAGPQVAAPGRECSALINGVDLFETILDYAGALNSESARSSQACSFLPTLLDAAHPGYRRYAFAEMFPVNGLPDEGAWQRAVRNADYKLIRRASGVDELFDLASDPFETTNLLDDPALAAVQADLELRLTLARL